MTPISRLLAIFAMSFVIAWVLALLRDEFQMPELGPWLLGIGALICIGLMARSRRP